MDGPEKEASVWGPEMFSVWIFIATDGKKGKSHTGFTVVSVEPVTAQQGS